MNSDIKEVGEERARLSSSAEDGGGHFSPRTVSAGPTNQDPALEVAGLQGSHRPMRYHCGDKTRKKKGITYRTDLCFPDHNYSLTITTGMFFFPTYLISS